MSTDEWCTPKWLADILGPFDLDPCSNQGSHIQAGRCFNSLDHDGLMEPWPQWASIFCNPPYSNVSPWAARLAAHPGKWTALVKLDPTTRWWATLMGSKPNIAPFRRRLRFEGTNTMTANFASVLVYKRWTPPEALREHLWLPDFSDEEITDLRIPFA